jgi:hypothetical protein
MNTNTRIASPKNNHPWRKDWSKFKRDLSETPKDLDLVENDGVKLKDDRGIAGWNEDDLKEELSHIEGYREQERYAWNEEHVYYDQND